MIYGVMYRDGCNFKKFFDAESDRQFNVGDDFLMEDTGLTRDEFFEKFLPEWEYDDEHDHNILEITSVLNKEENENIIIDFKIN